VLRRRRMLDPGGERRLIIFCLVFL
jgi:hypothetical protein